MNIKTRLSKLAKRRGPQAGGVVIELQGGGVRYQGKEYEDLADLPHGGGVLIVPGELPPAVWDPWAVEIQEEWQKALITGGSHESRAQEK